MRQAVLVGGGDLDLAALARILPAAAPGLSIGVDGGTAAFARAGARPDWVVGDFDSLGPDELAAMAEQGVKIRRYPHEKDQTDLELAIELAAELGADTAAIFGATGSRLDHTLVNLGMLRKARALGIEARIIAPGQEILLLSPGRHPLPGGPGRVLSLVPLTLEAAGIFTEGMRYPLRRETLYLGGSRGVHNECLGAEAAVSLESGELLAVIFAPGAPE